jgi:hypothetical protein
MEPVKAIQYLFPTATTSQFEVIAYPDGTWEITKWDVDAIQPTSAELETAWNDYVASSNYLTAFKQIKMNELDQACKNAILANFKTTLNNVEYEFAYDMAAQSRFNGTGILFLNGQITEVDWTAYLNGERTRITLTKDDFNIISLSALKHQNDNIAKYSDLYNRVNTATTEAQISNIKW